MKLPLPPRSLKLPSGMVDAFDDAVMEIEALRQRQTLEAGQSDAVPFAAPAKRGPSANKALKEKVA
jgi:hypothetical protein